MKIIKQNSNEKFESNELGNEFTIVTIVLVKSVIGKKNGLVILRSFGISATSPLYHVYKGSLGSVKAVYKQ